MYLQYGLWIGLMMARWAETCCQIYRLIIKLFVVFRLNIVIFIWYLYWITQRDGPSQNLGNILQLITDTKGTVAFVQLLGFSQRCGWRLRPSGIWCRVTVPGVSEERSAFIFSGLKLMSWPVRVKCKVHAVTRGKLHFRMKIRLLLHQMRSCVKRG
jgi:hypothetical protein